MLGMTGSACVLHMSLDVTSFSVVYVVRFLYVLWGYFLVEGAYVCALLSLCTFSIVSSDADLDFVEVRGHCVDTACVLIAKISLCTYIAKHVSVLWTLFIDWQANLVFGMWLCTVWIFDHYMTYLELLHYIYVLQSISVHYVLCRMCFYDKSYSKKNVFYAANLYAIGRYYWLWGTYSIFFWYVWQLKVNYYDIRNVWVRWNSSMYGLCIHALWNS